MIVHWPPRSHLAAIGCITMIIFAACSNHRQHPEEGSDKAVTLVLQFLKDIPLNKGHDVAGYVQGLGDSNVVAFDKAVERAEHVDNTMTIGVRYTSRKNYWSFYVSRISRNIYSLVYCTMEGRPTLLEFKVNIKTQVVEMNI